MKKLLWFGVVCVLLMPGVAKAQSALDGAWKFDMSKSQLLTERRHYLLQNGVWHCWSCQPPINIKADGQDHNYVGACLDTENVTVVDDRTIEVTTKKDGRVTEQTKITVSPDGKMLTMAATVTCRQDVGPVRVKAEYARVANGPAGAHVVSGSWRSTKINVSDNEPLVTLKIEGNSVAYSDLFGESYTAVLGGPSVLIKGDPDHEMVAATLVGKTIKETYRVNGKVIEYDRMTVAADGRTMNDVSTDVKSGKTIRQLYEKQ